MDWPTFFVAALIAVIFAAIVISGIRNFRRGRHSCGCSCGACGACGDSQGGGGCQSCHPDK